MTQLPPEQVLITPQEQMLSHMNPNLNYVNPLNINPMVQGQPNMLLNGNIPMNMSMSMPNNQPNNDSSNFYYINNYYFIF